jgi:hypothetical protein
MNVKEHTSGGKGLDERSEYHDPRTDKNGPSSTESIVYEGNEGQSTDGTEIVCGGNDA